MKSHWLKDNCFMMGPYTLWYCTWNALINSHIVTIGTHTIHRFSTCTHTKATHMPLIDSVHTHTHRIERGLLYFPFLLTGSKVRVCWRWWRKVIYRFMPLPVPVVPVWTMMLQWLSFLSCYTEDQENKYRNIYKSFEECVHMLLFSYWT